MPCCDSKNTVSTEFFARLFNDEAPGRAGHYLAMTARLSVSKAPDADSELQIQIFTDDHQASNTVLTKGKTTDITVALTGVQDLQIQLTCQSPDSEMTLGAPDLGARPDRFFI